MAPPYRQFGRNVRWWEVDGEMEPQMNADMDLNLIPCSSAFICGSLCFARVYLGDSFVLKELA